MLVIGLTGLAGSGKTSVAKYLKEKYGFGLITFSDIIKELALKEGWLTGKEGVEEWKRKLCDFGKEYRAKAGSEDVFAKIIVEKIKKSGKNFCVDGFRSPAEVLCFRKAFKDFRLVFVDADVHTRFLRRKKDDPNATIEKIMARDEIDIKRMNFDKVFSMADYRIDNNNGFEKTKQQIDNIITRA